METIKGDPKVKPTPGTQEDVNLMNQAQDGKHEALKKILDSEAIIIVQQPNEGGTAADEGAEATWVSLQ
jgi:hypothetical protein